MKNYKSTNIRNIAVTGHGKTGKTSLLDACLFNTGVVKRLGSVEDGTSALDYDPEENHNLVYPEFYDTDRLLWYSTAQCFYYPLSILVFPSSHSDPS